MRIDRLTLHTGPLSDAEARELARLVAEDIAGMPLPPAGAIRVELPRPAAGGVASLREAVARAVEAALVASRTDGDPSSPSGGRP